jgi:hypothetical protein
MAEATHAQKYFYKYMTAETAEKVIENASLRWSSPQKFNDPFDIQFDMHIDYKESELISQAINELWLAYSRKKEFEAKNRLGYFVKEMSVKSPGIAEADFKGRVKSGVVQSLAAQKVGLPKLQAWSRDQLQTVLVLCLTETPSNILMWAHYANCHTGVVLRFTTLDVSSWGAARPVMYRHKMPLLFDHEELLKFLTGRIQLNGDRLFHDSIYTKSMDWRYEKEWRVVWHGKEKVDYEDTKFNPVELSGLYLGCRVQSADSAKLIGLAKKLNANVEVFKGRKSDRTFTVEFDRQS